MNKLFFLVVLVTSCGAREPKPFNPDSAYVDSLMQDHHQAPGFITSDTADTSTQRAYDSTVKAEYGDTAPKKKRRKG